MHKLAKTVSYLLHPVFIPLLFVVFIFNLHAYPFVFLGSNVTWYVLGLVLVFNVLTPLLLMFTLKRTGYITSFFLETRRERFALLFLYTLLLYLTAVISKKWGLPPLWEVVILLNAMLSLFVILFLFFFRISQHLAGWGALAGLLFSLIYQYKADYIVWLTVVFVLSGIVAWSRAALKAHKTGEIISGFVLGFLVISAGLFYIIRISTV